MGLEALEFLEWAEIGIGIIETDHQPHRHLVVLQVIEERAAIGVPFQGPAHRMQHGPRLVARRVHFPKFLDAKAEGLRHGVGIKVEPGHQFLGKRSAATLSEQGLARPQLDPGLVVCCGRAVLAEAQISGRHPGHRAVFTEQHFGGGEAGIDLDPQRLGLTRQPTAEIAEADDVIAVIAHLRRGRQGKRPARGQQHEVVVNGGGAKGCALVLPIGDQLIERPGIKHRAGQNMGAYFRAFLDHADGNLPARLKRALLKTDRRREPRRAGANDDDVELHRFPVHGLQSGPSACTPRGGLFTLLRPPSGETSAQSGKIESI